MAIQDPPRHCSLEAAVGRSRVCPEAGCAFWEPGGAALGGRCAIEHLGIAPDAPLATWLLEIRERLEAGSSEEEQRALRGVFHHLLNGSSD
ncbi:MAG TPA: hypothetical protein VIR14_01980 [Gaiellaceae bacterium]